MNKIQVKLYSPSTFKSADPVTILFEVTNNSDKTVSILKWYTPLEGMRSPCLRVLAGRKEIPYEGIKVKRGPVSVNSFIAIEPGQSIIKMINLEESYNIPLSGNIKVEFRTETLETIGTKELVVNKDLPSIRKYKTKLTTTGCNFSVSRSRKTVQTLAMQNRSQKKSKSFPISILAVKDPLFQGMNDAEKAIVKQAHKDGFTLTSNSITGLANDAKYKKWFGAHTAGRFNTVKGVFTAVKKGMESTVFTYIKNGPDCDADTVAYTFDNSDKIYLCALFWGLPATGLDSKAGTVVHEHTHATATTEDDANDTAACEALAKNDPDKAIDNACSFEYYAES